MFVSQFMGKTEGYEVWKIVNSSLVWIFDFTLSGEREGMFSRVSSWTNNNGHIIMHRRIRPITAPLLWAERRHHAKSWTDWVRRLGKVFSVFSYVVWSKQCKCTTRSLKVIPGNRNGDTIGLVQRSFFVFPRTCLEVRSRFLARRNLSMYLGTLTRKTDVTKPSDCRLNPRKEAVSVQ